MVEFFKKIFSGVALMVGFGLTTIVLVESCKKEEEKPKAEITVVDSAGAAIPDAKVVLFCVQDPDASVRCNVADTQFTDGAGKVNFEFDNPSVLKLLATKFKTVERDTGVPPFVGVVVTGDTLCAEGFVTLENNEIAEEVFVLKRCTRNLGN